MRIITESVVAALKQVGVDAKTLSETELAQVDAEIDAKVSEIVAAKVAEGITAAMGDKEQRLADLEADMGAIRGAIENPELTAEATTHTVAQIAGTSPVNATDVQGVGTNLPPGTVTEGDAANSNEGEAKTE